MGMVEKDILQKQIRQAERKKWIKSKTKTCTYAQRNMSLSQYVHEV